MITIPVPYRLADKDVPSSAYVILDLYWQCEKVATVKYLIFA